MTIISMDLNKFLGALEKSAIADGEMKMTREEALAKGLCVVCGEPALAKCYSEAGRREYQISGSCESCFDEMFKEEE
jgi:hypothetical protein